MSVENKSNNMHAENILRQDTHKTQVTSSKNYFSSLADKYSKASHILYMALLVCFILTLVFNSKILTYDNFSYLFKDINTAAEIASSNYNSISYSNDPLRITKGFRGGIITASTTDMAIYNATGKKSLHINESFVQPQISVSKKYAIIYDQGGNKYSIYNSFSRVHNAKTSHPISFITVADNGWYAIASRDDEHTSAVYLYDDDFNLRNSYLFASKFVFSVSINEKGNRIAIVSTESAPTGDGFMTSVLICDPGKDASRAEIDLGSGIPYGISFASDELINVVCSDGLYALSENDGGLKNKYEFNNSYAKMLSMSPEGCAIVFADNQGTVSNLLYVFDENGDLAYNTVIKGGISDIEYKDDNVFINLNESVVRINIKNGGQTSVPSFEKGTDIIVYDSNNILLCCQTKAKYINF